MSEHAECSEDALDALDEWVAELEALDNDEWLRGETENPLDERKTEQ